MESHHHPDVIFSLGHQLPSCPVLHHQTSNNTHRTNHDLGYPSVTVIYGVITVIGVLFTFIIGCKYNSVRVFNKKVRTENISNTMWMAYFLILSIRTASNTIFYGLPQEEEPIYLESVVFVLSAIVHGIDTTLLCFALNHQRRYRSTTPPSAAQPKTEADPLIARYSWVKNAIGVPEITFMILLIIYLVCLILQILKHPNRVYEILYLSSFALQRVPVLILILAIVLRRNTDGPTLHSKIYAFIGVTLNLFGDVPLPIWASVFPDSPACPLWIGSYTDIIHVVYLISLVFLFLFVRSEYLRNMEECIWDTVSQIQDTFDFRKF